MLSGGSHLSGSFTGESSSWRKYSFTPMLSESPKSATLITKLQSILKVLSPIQSILAFFSYHYLHAVSSCQVYVHHFHASKIFHSLGNLNAHVHQLFANDLHLVQQKTQGIAIKKTRMNLNHNYRFIINILIVSILMRDDQALSVLF